MGSGEARGPPGSGTTGRARLVAGLLGLVAAFFGLAAWLVHESDADVVRSDMVHVTEAERSAPTLEIGYDTAEPERLAPEASVEPVPKQEPAASAVTPAVQEEARTIAVRVVDGRLRPVVGADVEVWVAAESPAPKSLLSRLLGGSRRVPDFTRDPTTEPPDALYATDALGEARFQVGTGQVTVVASKTDHGTSGRWMPGRRWEHGFPRPLEDGEVEPDGPMVLPLRPTLEVHGQVLKSDGRPSLGAEVTWYPTSIGEEGLTGPRIPAAVTTDDDGRFTFEVDRGDMLTLQAKHGGRTAKKMWMPDASETRSPEIPLRLPGGFGVRGVVVAEQGASYAGTLVTAMPGMGAGGVFSDRVDADGAFEVELAEPGEYRLRASRAGAVTAEPVSVSVSEVEPFAEVSLRLIPASRITGRVVWDDGTPVADARITGRMDRSGRPDLPYTLMLIGNAEIQTIVSVKDVQPGAEDVEIVVDRERAAGVTIHGRVFDARTGNPITEFEVRHGAWIRSLFLPESRFVRDPGGRFTLTGLHDHERGLQIEAEGYPVKTMGPLEFGAGPLQLEIALQSYGGLHLRVVDADGQSLGGATASVAFAVSEESPDLFAGGWRGTVPSEGSTWDEAPPGRVMVQAAHGGKVSDLVFGRIEGGRTETLEVVVAADDLEGWLTVDVLDRDGRPQAGAPVAVNLMGPLGDPSGVSRQATTDATGRAVLEGLSPGHYWVWPKVEGSFLSPRWTPVPAEHQTTVVFHLGDG